MVRNKVQPYIEPTTELVDVVGMGAGNATAISKRGMKKNTNRAFEGRKYGSVRTPKRSRVAEM